MEAQVVSLTFLKAMVRKRANIEWRNEIINRRQGIRSFRILAEGEVQKIPEELRRAPKEFASRYFQLASGHAMIAPLMKEKFGWIESDLCWCGSGRVESISLMSASRGRRSENFGKGSGTVGSGQHKGRYLMQGKERSFLG